MLPRGIYLIELIDSMDDKFFVLFYRVTHWIHWDATELDKEMETGCWTSDAQMSVVSGLYAWYLYFSAREAFLFLIAINSTVNSTMKVWCFFQSLIWESHHLRLQRWKIVDLISYIIMHKIHIHMIYPVWLYHIANMSWIHRKRQTIMETLLFESNEFTRKTNMSNYWFIALIYLVKSSTWRSLSNMHYRGHQMWRTGDS